MTNCSERPLPVLNMEKIMGKTKEKQFKAANALLAYLDPILYSARYQPLMNLAYPHPLYAFDDGGNLRRLWLRAIFRTFLNSTGKSDVCGKSEQAAWDNLWTDTGLCKILSFDRPNNPLEPFHGKISQDLLKERFSTSSSANPEEPEFAHFYDSPGQIYPQHLQSIRETLFRVDNPPPDTLSLHSRQHYIKNLSWSSHFVVPSDTLPLSKNSPINLLTAKSLSITSEFWEWIIRGSETNPTSSQKLSDPSAYRKIIPWNWDNQIETAILTYRSLLIDANEPEDVIMGLEFPGLDHS